MLSVDDADQPTPPMAGSVAPADTGDVPTPGESVRSVDPPAQPAEPASTAEPASVRLVDPEPLPDPAATAAETATNEPPGPGPNETGQTPGDEIESVVEPAVPQISPWSIPAPAGDRVAFQFNLGKIPGQGEDADPILHESRDLGLVAVFDGMGGAGGTTYATAEGPRTGAYLASRTTRDAVERRVLDLLPRTDLDGPTMTSDLHDSISAALRTRLAELQAPRSMLRSKLLRALPTTMAMAAVRRDPNTQDAWECDLLWAGDSRVYLLHPDSGAAQLTTDDIRDRGDAMGNLRQDSVISNALSADTPFVVNHRRVRLDVPFIVIAATDGCFGYLSTPMHFEWLLLSTLQQAPDPESWSELLQTRITAISGDDASMAVLGIGSDHKGLQTLFVDRATALDNQWVRPLDQLEAERAELEQRLDDLGRRKSQQTVELWDAYRPGYE